MYVTYVCERGSLICTSGSTVQNSVITDCDIVKSFSLALLLDILHVSTVS